MEKNDLSVFLQRKNLSFIQSKRIFFVSCVLIMNTKYPQAIVIWPWTIWEKQKTHNFKQCWKNCSKSRWGNLACETSVAGCRAAQLLSTNRRAGNRPMRGQHSQPQLPADNGQPATHNSAKDWEWKHNPELRANGAIFLPNFCARHSQIIFRMHWKDKFLERF